MPLARAGGDDFDIIIVDWLVHDYLQAIDCKDPSTMANLKAVAERAKVDSFVV